MTNTMNTPIEALETYYPLRVAATRSGAAPAAAAGTPGGDGVVREIEFLAPARSRCSASAAAYRRGVSRAAAARHAGADHLLPANGACGASRPRRRSRCEAATASG
jgi:N-methylhydantoinase B